MASVLDEQPLGEREFVFTTRDFEAVRELLYRHTGIKLHDSKQPLVYSRLARRLRQLGFNRFDQYLAYVNPDGEEWQQFLNALTTNLTSFFREVHHFEHLAGFVKSLPRSRQVRVWCSASSTGEEPYSIAMTLIEAYGTYDPPASIVATDIDTQVLQTASRGVYPLDRLEKIALERKRQFFLRGKGDQDGFARIRPEVAKLIEFKRLNLLDNPWPLEGLFDVIFCRNVLIYFDKETQAKVLRRMAPLIRPDGVLYVGHSESLFHVADCFENCGRTVYRVKTS
ncbi:CheR family methyltransferase [Parachitinimonas caeni]|uniref:Chemotaxis protein methyltransferase n=1 Tax=Parachitinimonas caeni TaxID=3031301 RepID=A0ABT7DTL1_9NEIS|nr:CheR family methyltransferase [Parachitinimonas caeni]MDK2123426.1 CheR family methyltransferase [Parachitinimonas caeni]